MAILCLDYGDRYIGVAVADITDKIALRHSTIDQSRSDALTEIKNITASVGVKKVLVGVPLSLEGGETEQTHKSLAFLEQLQKELGPAVEVESVDETLTSVEAERRIRAEGSALEDAHAEAARLMLADYLRTMR